MAALLIGLAVILATAVYFFLSSRKDVPVPPKATDYYGAVVKDVDGTKHFSIR